MHIVIIIIIIIIIIMHIMTTEIPTVSLSSAVILDLHATPNEYVLLLQLYRLTVSTWRQ